MREKKKWMVFNIFVKDKDKLVDFVAWFRTGFGVGHIRSWWESILYSLIGSNGSWCFSSLSNFGRVLPGGTLWAHFRESWEISMTKFGYGNPIGPGQRHPRHGFVSLITFTQPVFTRTASPLFHESCKPDTPKKARQETPRRRTAMINLYKESLTEDTKSSPQPTSASHLPSCRADLVPHKENPDIPSSNAHIRQTCSPMNMFRWCLLLLASQIARGCTDIYNDYDLLLNELDFAQESGTVLLCPFVIEGSQCPEEPYVVTSPFMFVFCASFGGGAGDDACVINCPGTHFSLSKTCICIDDDG